MVGGKGPFSFLVDTGAERTVIARELAERLGLAEGAKLRLATIGGSATVPSYRIAALQMAKLHLASVEAPAFFGRHIGAAGLIVRPFAGDGLRISVGEEESVDSVLRIAASVVESLPQTHAGRR